ncbi:MAG: pyrroloquinoline quinone biosynthesis protein PqqB [Candidatus Cohnella colombiensis]|uniref:Coenzyme PQQ synthesis protein B n=1 Tax=Candidatus Cohnella colombiensis TaxID=3121368 RepID=A0AA95EXI9_9BACL|nr:MAG: pyrroloquinoline quinone biosynthesis protein PqqB [Cohnella sp.]
MFIRVLGSAAGGGLPQWNCNCPNCHKVRNGDRAVHARTNDSLAISDNGQRWYLINATPNVTAQIEAFSPLYPGPHIRATPILGVLLTDAELDHTIGLLQLRECAQIEVYAAPPVLHALNGAFPIKQILEPYAQFRWSEVSERQSFTLFEDRVRVYPFQLGSKPPRYASKGEEGAWVIGYRIVDQWTGGVVVYAPGVESWSEDLDEQLANADCVFVDGTFWRTDELRQLDISQLGAMEMGHIPISGAGGSLERLVKVEAQRKIYIHINNTNPILDQHSEEYRTLQAHRIEVGYDGLELEV